MEPKEKAELIVSRFMDIIPAWDYYNDIEDKDAQLMKSKKCAMILVDEMLNNAGFIWGGHNHETGLSARDGFRKYWNEAKQEIQKL